MMFVHYLKCLMQAAKDAETESRARAKLRKAKRKVVGESK